MSVTGGWMLWLFVDVHVVLESERGNIAWYPYRCVPVYRCTCTSYLCAHLYTCNLLSTCMYVHTGTVHVVQERMDILPYMCVPYTGVRWGGWGAGGENQKKWYPGTTCTHFSIHYSISYFNKPTTLANMRRPTAGDVNILSG